MGETSALGERKRRRKPINLRRNRISTATNFAPDDVLVVAWDDAKRAFTVTIETVNGLLIRHKALTPPDVAA
jgi:hypothetical protein